MIQGVSHFNKTASAAYGGLEDEERERLFMQSKATEETRTLSSTDIIASGSKVFRKIQNQVKWPALILCFYMKYLT